MDIDVLEHKLAILNNLDTCSSRFILNLFKNYLKDVRVKKDIFDSDFITVNPIKFDMKNVINVNKYSFDKKIINNSVIYINLNDYEIGKNWFYSAQNNLYCIYVELAKASDIELENERYIDNLLIRSQKLKNEKLYTVDTFKHKLYKLLRKLNKVIEQENIEKISYIIRYDEKDILKYNYVLNELVAVLKIILFKDYRLKVSYVYDYISDFMDNEFRSYNFCDFLNNQCIAQRDSNNHFSFPYEKYNGCCYDVRTKSECEFLDVKSCEKCKIKSVSCKLLICGYLREMGINYSIYDSLLVRTFFNIKQKTDCVWNFYEKKENMMKKFHKKC